MDSSTGPATHAAVQTSVDRYDPAAQARRAVLRLEQALAAASQWNGDRTAGPVSATAVGVEAEPSVPATDVGAAHPTREVARFEDLLTVAPPQVQTAASIPPPVAASIPPPTEAPPASAPFAAIADLPLSAEEYLSGAVEVEPVSPPIAAEAPVAEPTYVEAHVLREAFWFEHAAALAFSPDPQEETAEEAPVAEESAQCNWLTAICLLTLMALMLVLTGRSRRR